MRFAAFVILSALTALVAGCGKPTGSQSGPDGGPRGDGSDQDKLQGVWAVEKYDTGEPDRGPPADEIQKVRVHFDGNKIRMNGRLKFSMVLDTASNPKVMIVTEVNEDGKPQERFGGEKGEIERVEWLYKFDGDSLVLAILDGPGKRPSNFTPRPSSGDRPFITGGPKGVKTIKDDNYVPAVNILRLQKTDEAPPAPPKPRPGPQPTRKQ
jgi:uncharacterized protein (TIGR03067 family)